MTDNTDNVPNLGKQAEYWAQWNQATREAQINPVSLRQAQTIIGWIEALKRRDLRILDAGCGSGWMCERMIDFGAVTGLDLSPEMLRRAQARVPAAKFVAGSITEAEWSASSFDVIVSMEVLSHVQDQQAFFSRCAHLLKKGGSLMLSTQNAPIYQRMLEIAPPSPNQIRKWVDARQLRALATKEFDVQSLSTICIRGYGGYLRYVNSVKLNLVLRKVFSGEQIERLKERLGFGCTLILRARRR